MFKKKNAINDSINSSENADDIDKKSANFYQIDHDKSPESSKNNQLAFDQLNTNQINPKNLLKDYEAIKLCAINPNLKEKIILEIEESKQVLQKINRLIDKF
jgi:hypothetical protein